LFWDYDSDLNKAVTELGILRQSLLLADADHTAPVIAPPPSPSTAPVFSSLIAAMPAPLDPKSSSPDIMNIEQLAQYTGFSSSWLYKHYEEEGIPCTKPGGLRFRKESVDEWWRLREAKSSTHSNDAKAVHKPIKAVSDSVTANDLGAKDRSNTESLDERVHPQTLSRINKLIALLWEKDYLSQSDSQRLKNWILRGSKLDSGEAQLLWLKLRKSLVTCIVLCQHAGLISIPESQGKKLPRPDYAATIERDFTAEDKSRLQNIDRDYAKDIEEEVSFFTSHVQAYAKKNELDFPLDNILLSALNEYFDDIDGSEGMAEEAMIITDSCKALDFPMLRLFHSIAAC